MSRDPERAGRLWGGLQTFKQEFGWGILSSDIDLYDTAIAARSESDPIAFEAATERGRRMSSDEIVAYALAETTSEAKTKTAEKSSDAPNPRDRP
jgi:hypothetical protein